MTLCSMLQREWETLKNESSRALQRVSPRYLQHKCSKYRRLLSLALPSLQNVVNHIYYLSFSILMLYTSILFLLIFIYFFFFLFLSYSILILILYQNQAGRFGRFETYYILILLQFSNLFLRPAVHSSLSCRPFLQSLLILFLSKLCLPAKRHA